ncbi:MAG TPA: hypothetical protein VM124_01040 [Candidatus Limnocylindrales bacterium]|nr:hypothetical protein [Candidatus Limnocylindrales bacterium]
MPTLKKKTNFLQSEAGDKARKALYLMASDDAYNTRASYIADGTDYPDNLIPFVDKHMNYLNTHPSIDVGQYLSNLRLMVRIR